MRHPKKIKPEEENHRLVELAPGIHTSKVDPVKPEPEGTYVILAFRIDGYDPDCDGSLMWRGANVHFDDPNKTTGFCVDALGLYKGVDLIVTAKELRALYEQASGDE